MNHTIQRVRVFDDEVTVLEDETIEFFREASPRPTSSPITPIVSALRPQPDGCEDNGVSCCCCPPTTTQNHHLHHHYNVDGDIDDAAVKSNLQCEAWLTSNESNGGLTRHGISAAGIACRQMVGYDAVACK